MTQAACDEDSIVATRAAFPGRHAEPDWLHIRSQDEDTLGLARTRTHSVLSGRRTRCGGTYMSATEERDD